MGAAADKVGAAADELAGEVFEGLGEVKKGYHCGCHTCMSTARELYELMGEGRQDLSDEKVQAILELQCHELKAQRRTRSTETSATERAAFLVLRELVGIRTLKLKTLLSMVEALDEAYKGRKEA